MKIRDSFRRPSDDCHPYAVEIIAHVDRLDTQRFNTLIDKPGVALVVASASMFEVMVHSVDLDRQPRLDAVEIENERPDRMLSPKPQSRRFPAPERTP